MTNTPLNSILRTLMLVFLTCVFVIVFKVLQPAFIGFGLDSSWSAALLEGRYLNLRFGDQIIFTGGPLSHVYTHLFSSQLFHEKLVTVILFATFYAGFFETIWKQNKSYLAVCVGIVPFFFNLFDDPLYIALPFCSALLGTLKLLRLRFYSLMLLGSAASAVATMAKFSVFPIAFVGFAVVDIIALRDRRLPVSLVTYLLTLWAVLAVTSPGASLVQFIRASWDVVAGYADAMSLPGSWLEVGGVFLSIVGLIGLVGACEWRRPRVANSSRIIALGRVVIVAAFLVVCTKAGLVRHDLHAVIAWEGLGFMAAVYCAFSWTLLPRAAAMILIVMATAAITMSHARLVGVINLPPGVLLSDHLFRRYDELANWAKFLGGPKEWLQRQSELQAEAMERVRAELPLPRLQGTVDIIPSLQSSLIASGLQYRPRPSLQEYATYTRALIEKNRAFFQDSDAPEFLFMQPYPLDNRHPALTEGPLWPLFLARYAPQDVIEGMVLLHQRDSPVSVPLQELRHEIVRWDAPVKLESMPDGATFAKIDIRPTLAGRLANLLFKSSTVFIDVEYADGDVSRYRLIPAIAREGFFISPLIETGVDYLTLASGMSDTLSKKVKSFVLRRGTLGTWLLQDQVTVMLSHLQDTALREETESRIVWPNLAAKLGLLAVLRQNPPRPPFYNTVAQGLFAHPPLQLTLKFATANTLSVAFGMLDAAWKEGDTDGVCFKVSVAGANTALWQRCLDPKENPADRGLQSARVELPEGGGRLILETTCRQSCNRDWSYWGEVTLH